MVLVVDSSRESARRLAESVERCGRKAILAGDVVSAAELAWACRPRAALLDVGTPAAAPLDTARKLRAVPGLFLIAVSELGAAPAPVPAADVRFDAYLFRPFADAELCALLDVAEVVAGGKPSRPAPPAGE